VDYRHRFVAHVRSAWGGAEIDVGVEQFPELEVLGEGGRGDQPGVSDEMLVVEGHRDTVQTVR